MLQFFDTLQDDSGNALLGATVTVTNYPAGTLASIYNTNGTASPIPTASVVADITGQVSFYIPDGAYTITYAYKGTNYKVRQPVQILDPMGFVAATDTGAANAYAVVNAGYPASLYTGLKLEFKATNTNTGASTLALNGGAAQPIVLPGGTALQAGIIQANGITRLEWDGAAWQLVGSLSQPNYPRTIGEVYAAIVPASPGYMAGQVGGLTMNVLRFMSAAQITSYLNEDGLVDHTAVIQQANDFLEGRSAAAAGGAPHPGGRLFFPAGLANILGNVNTLRVGGNVTWYGDQYRAATLNFASVANTGIAITLGPDNSGFFGYSGSYTMGSAIENMHISMDPQNQFSTIIATAGAHQGSHLKQLLIEGCNQRAISLGNTGGPAYFWVEDINIQGGTREALPGAREGIFTQVGGLFRGREITVEGGAAHLFSIGVRVNLGGTILENLHFENGTDGVYYDNQTGNNCAAHTINGISGNASMTQLVHIPNPCNQTVTVMNVTGISGDPSHPIAIKNEVTGEALLNTNVGVYSWSGDASGARAGAFGYSAIHNTPHIRYGKSATQAILQNTFTALTFPTKTDDSLNVSEWSGSVFTPKIPGRYRVTVCCALASIAWTAGSILRIYILKNGATQSTYEDDAAVGTFVRQIEHSDTVNCVAGDTISTGIFQGQTATVNTDSSAATCFIAIDRV